MSQIRKKIKILNYAGIRKKQRLIDGQPKKRRKKRVEAEHVM